jgi:hypothetical protein
MTKYDSNESKVEKIVKEKKTKQVICSLNEIGIIFIKNKMLDYIDTNVYKIGCCLNYGTTLKEDLTQFIEPCTEVEYISVDKYITDENLTNKNKIEIGKKIIMIVYENELLLNYKHRHIATAVISDEIFNEKLEELKEHLQKYGENVIKYDANVERYEELKNKQFNYKKNKYENDRGEIFYTLKLENVKEILKTITLPTKKSIVPVKLMAYSVESFKYYGNMCCVDIMNVGKTVSRMPKTSYVLVSDYEKELEETKYENYIESITSNTKYLIIFLTEYFKNTQFCVNSLKKIMFLKTELTEIKKCFKEMEENKQLFDLPFPNFKKAIKTLYKTQKEEDVEDIEDAEI